MRTVKDDTIETRLPWPRRSRSLPLYRQIHSSAAVVSASIVRVSACRPRRYPLTVSKCSVPVEPFRGLTSWIA